MDLQFCQQCGERLLLIEIGDEGVVPHSTACTRSYLAHPACSVLVSAINENTLNIVLLRQDNVSDSHWVLVAGYTSNRVSVRSIQLRGVLEETGLQVRDTRCIDSYHPRGQRTPDDRVCRVHL